MRILLDECVPWPMRQLLAGHECMTAQQRGWGGITNGDLLRLAEGECDYDVRKLQTPYVVSYECPYTPLLT